MRKFHLGDDVAWDRDFEQQGVGSPAAGTDTIWAETVDIAFFSVHGSPGGFLFGIADKGDGLAKPAELQCGHGGLNWIALDACNVLAADGVFDRWRPAFKGLHYVLGFHTTTDDEPLAAPTSLSTSMRGTRCGTPGSSRARKRRSRTSSTPTSVPKAPRATPSTTTGSGRGGRLDRTPATPPRRQSPNAAALESHVRALTAVVADHGVPPKAIIAQAVARLLAGPRLKDACG